MAVEPASFKDLPGPLRIGVALASGGGLLATIWVVTSQLPPKIRGTAVLGITLGIMAVGVLLVVYTQFVKWRKARRAKPMEQQVLHSAGTGRQGISDPEQLARIDDLRKKFEEGIATFRSAGKSLYNLPWHVILGEPGSGKTEAIRHCGIGFPPGLHDRYQGVGGTINMNWWFTDHGVIIDTAGRLMFEEASSGGTREWKEFLALLKKFRPNCPINGALLVIPCDSLIRDNADEIERKASQIAQQFDVIQRTLDVRFPVYIVVTKSDLINGFREFFDDVSDPQLQHQILGWSNPQELDKPYDPHIVDKYLEEMKARLFRTRLTRVGQLLGQEAEEDEKPGAHALYAFPHAFEQLGPRLKRYLDLIFCVGSQWSCKPLFFRGIYFTSSMQEGAALDEDLAAALGVPVDSLPAGPVWRRDRAYFLRDLFTAKVFREWGLVTRATNARKLYARRRAAVLSFAAGSLLVLIALTAYGGWRFQHTVGSLQGLLAPAVEETDSLRLLDRDRFGEYAYKGDRKLHDGTPLHQYHADLAVQADDWRKSKGIPWIFRPAVRWEIEDRLQEAARKVYLTGVLQPLLGAAAEKMAGQSEATWTWEKDEPQVLYDLVALRAGRPFDKQALLDSLVRYVQPQEADAYTEHKAALALPLLRLYDYPPSRDFDAGMIAQIDKAIAAGVGSFNAYWSHPRSERSELSALTNVVRCLTGAGVAGTARDPNNFADLEQQFLAKYATIDPNTDVGEQLDQDFRKLTEAKVRVDQARGALGDCPSLQQAWLSPVDKHLELVKTSYRKLMEAFPENVSDSNQVDATLKKHYQDLTAGLENCSRSLSDPGFKNRLTGVDNEFWTGGLYDQRFRMYQTAVERLRNFRATRIAGIDSLRDTVQEGRRHVQEDEKAIQDILKRYTERHRVKEGHQVAVVLLRHGDQRFCREVVRWWLGNMPVEALTLERYVRGNSNDPYNLTGTANVFSVWESLNRDCQIPQMPRDIQARAQRVAQEYARYAGAYVDYWLKQRGPDMLRDKVRKDPDWAARHTQLSQMRDKPEPTYETLVDVRDDLRRYLEPVATYVRDSNAVSQFERAWKPLTDEARPFYRDRCQTILANWSQLSADPRSARLAILKLAPDRFLGGYFVAPSSGSVAAPDCFWHHLSLTSLELLAAEVDRDSQQDLEAVKGCAGKFPLDKWGSENLTAAEVDRIHRFAARFLGESYPPGTIGAGAKTANGQIDDLLERLRAAATPPTWIRNAGILPPARGNYWCQVAEVKTTPARRVRKVVIAKGPPTTTGAAGVAATESLTWDDTKSYPKGVELPLRYDCSSDTIQLTFVEYTPSGSEAPVEKPQLFPGPWAWHRLLERHEFEQDTSTYVLRHTLNYRGEKIAVELRLRFFKERDCSGTPLEVFVSAP